jgi:carbamoyl-phosphate synthase small subunit
MAGRALVAKVSTRKPFVFSDAGRARIAVVDYGCKRSILNRLAWSGAAVTVYPHDVDADELAEYDGVLLSNGPGDPEPLTAEQATIRHLIGARPDPRDLSRPPAARARDRSQDVQAAVRPPRREPSGARARDERRARHPRRTTASRSRPRTRARRRTSPSTTAPSEGLELRSEWARSVQFHPEAGPGPHDAWGILESWVEEVGGLAKAA